MDRRLSYGCAEKRSVPPAVAGGYMWNDTDTPLAYLITFRCYGTWLHGDKRGSTDRVRNVYKSPHINPNERWQRHNRRSLKLNPVKLNIRQRASVEQAIRDMCTIR